MSSSKAKRGSNVGSAREEINRIDQEILELLSKRREQSSTIIDAKEEDNRPLRDQDREKEVLLDRIDKGRELGLDAHLVTSVFHKVIDDSLRVQQESLQRKKNNDQQKEVVQIAFQGLEGTYSHLASLKHFSRYGTAAKYNGYHTYRDTLDAVEAGKADYALIPIDNTTSGGINEVYDLLLHTPLSIIGEEKYEIAHCLVGLEGGSITEVSKIFSNPHSVLQCSEFLSSLPKCSIEYFSDSVRSVRRICDDQDKTQAAIASEETAHMFGLTVIKAGIANQEGNNTRYIIVSRKARNVDIRIPSKTSLVMATGQQPGSLVQALTIFKDKGINITKLESRPMPGNPGEEMFYIDFQGNLEDERVTDALEELRRQTKYLKVLGCYPCEDLAPTIVVPSATKIVSEGEPQAKKKDGSEKKIIPSSYKLASREYKSENTVIEIGGVSIGGDGFMVMAGPCSIESEEQIIACAKHAKENGAVILRGGCFKPRTSPYSFQGLGFEGLDFMKQAGSAHGLPIITEVLSEDDVEGVAAKSDMLQIGARNMQNYSLLRAVGRTHRPVLLKRGMSSSIQELLQASEYILSQGNHQVMLCERGIRTFETATRCTLDLSAVPVLKRKTHLPIIVDPSHAAGTRELVPALSLAAKAIGAHGIIVEFHPNPEEALSDGPQALRFAQFAKMMSDLQSIEVRV